MKRALTVSIKFQDLASERALFQRFTEDDDIVEKIKEEAKTKLENLFSINELDDDVVKSLKTQKKDDLLNANTYEEGEIDKLQKKLGVDVLELDGLIDTAMALKTAKEKYKKERLDEELPSDADIDSDSELPANFKEEAKLIREEKAIELTPTPTTTMGEIKKHLTETLQNFGKTVAKEMKPKIENAIKTDTLDGYRELDKEWGQNKADTEGQVEYNADREYMAT
ncbi:996_t:CDS:2 [Cetraspora pellucida]|uniref:996_t:CDS:1 n=1 Tax=Cetraspora pellucida TaxID=1433469 RepID=A0ACA9MI39_9GLOM|nr:996_t:CDS:2 [Cetraspora pellucida]